MGYNDAKVGKGKLILVQPHFNKSKRMLTGTGRARQYNVSGKSVPLHPLKRKQASKLLYSMQNKYLFRRYLLFAIALFINAMGIAYITKANLGTSPITSVTYVASMFTPLTMGQWTIILNLLFVLLELPFMTRRQVREDLRMYLTQIVITFVFGLCIDLCMGIIHNLNPITYISKIANLLIGCVILAVGIALEVKADVAMMAGEYFVRVLVKKFHRDFGYLKLAFDWSLVAVAVALSLVFMGGVYGVREGTVIAALLVGPIVHFVTPYYRFIDRWITDKQAVSIQSAVPAADTPHTVITIAREFGSGGHLLGEMLARELGIKLYDKEFIHLAAQKSGIDEEYIRRNEQSIPSFWLKCILAAGSEASRERSLSPDDVLFVAESNIIRELAAQGPCIIVGRCADYVLQDRPRLIKVFCYADPQSLYHRCTTEYGVPADKAQAEIARVNRNRIAHYEYYTGGRWGDPHRYDLMLNTGSMGLQTACELVAGLYRKEATATGKPS